MSEIRTVWEWDIFGKRRSPNVRISDVYCIVVILNVSGDCDGTDEHPTEVLAPTVGQESFERAEEKRRRRGGSPSNCIGQ